MTQNTPLLVICMAFTTTVWRGYTSPVSRRNPKAGCCSRQRKTLLVVEQSVAQEQHGYAPNLQAAFAGAQGIPTLLLSHLQQLNHLPCFAPPPKAHIHRLNWQRIWSPRTWPREGDKQHGWVESSSKLSFSISAAQVEARKVVEIFGCSEG
ncbi:hypothetical protein ACN38_g5148 [Penicillium nordicum]|uniref:Secreted protein n=1 Tax=Penicillium nordicum TaxID=229535 RepID=A0A0M8P5J4_9EURO|nr:hypothetical protein ACN38_g5148 [Penicillium nordicum]